LASLERKIIVGGENLLEKAELQSKLLEESEKQLEKQKEKREIIRQKLEEKEVNNGLINDI
jgi:kinesin family protein 3/17